MPIPTPVREFTVRVDEAVIVDLRERLARTRWPDEINDDQWSYGTRLPVLKSLIDYWRTKFDWRKQEERLNRFPQFTANVDGYDIHFIHQKSKAANAIPIIVTHGWPGSVFEFLDVIPRLAESFDVVVPSLPGFGFSSHPTSPGTSPRRIASLWVTLMTEILGYSRFGAQGGDWGAHITTQLARNHANALHGIHLNFVPGYMPGNLENLSPAEERVIEERKRWREEEGAYSHVQGTKPQSLAYALTDSPAGLCGWFLEKYRSWSDAMPSNDQILTHVTLYWVTQSIASASRIYYESLRDPVMFARGDRITVPTAVAIFPKEISHPPRSWVERMYNVEQFTEMPRGGHFAAQEEPQLFAEDVLTFFRKFA